MPELLFRLACLTAFLCYLHLLENSVKVQAGNFGQHLFCIGQLLPLTQQTKMSLYHCASLVNVNQVLMFSTFMAIFSAGNHKEYTAVNTDD